MFINYLKQEHTEDLKLRVQNHKERFVKLFYNRYRELMINLIVYKNADSTATNFLRVESALRNNYNVVIGENKLGNIQMLGVINSNKDVENPNNFLPGFYFNKDDVTFTIPKKFIPNDIQEITTADNCKTGNVVVLRNKTINYVNDLEVLLHYTLELAELVISRYSLAMQSKINTFFMSDINNETINQVINDLYNGSPYIKISDLFDVKDNIYTMENGNLAQNFAELKREYQNKISELNNMLGINSLAVEKTSGVSDTEAKSNRGYTTSNANIYLTARNNPLSRLNKRYGLNIQAVYNDNIESEITELEREGFSSENNDNHNGNYPI